MAGEPLPAGVDLFALGVRGLGFAVSVGATAITGVLWGVQSILPQVAGSPTPASGGPPFYLLVFGTVGAMGLAALTCWFVLRPVDSWFRRGGLSIVSAFASFVVALLTLPATMLLGRVGLLAASGAFAALAWAFWRGLRRWNAAR
jgi:hypothetical protein